MTSLLGVIRQLQSSGYPVMLNEHPDVIVHGDLTCSLEIVAEDRGLAVHGPRALCWRRSSEGWQDVVGKLQVLEAAVAPGHHYLNGPSDDLQVMAAVGEYGEEWWRSHLG